MIQYINELEGCLSCGSSTTRRSDGRPECHPCRGETSENKQQLREARRKCREAQKALKIPAFTITVEPKDSWSPQGTVAELCCWACEESKIIRARTTTTEMENWLFRHLSCEFRDEHALPEYDEEMDS